MGEEATSETRPVVVNVTGFVGFPEKVRFYDQRGQLAETVSDRLELQVDQLNETQVILRDTAEDWISILDDHSVYFGVAVRDTRSQKKIGEAARRLIETSLQTLGVNDANFIGTSSTSILEVGSDEHAEALLGSAFAPVNSSVFEPFGGVPLPSEWHSSKDDGSRYVLTVKPLDAASAAGSDLPWDEAAAYPDFLIASEVRLIATPASLGPHDAAQTWEAAYHEVETMALEFLSRLAQVQVGG